MFVYLTTPQKLLTLVPRQDAPERWREPSKLLHRALHVLVSEFVVAPVALAQDYAYFVHFQMLLSHGRPAARNEVAAALEKASCFARTLLRLTTNVGLANVMRLLVANPELRLAKDDLWPDRVLSDPAMTSLCAADAPRTAAKRKRPRDSTPGVAKPRLSLNVVALQAQGSLRVNCEQTWHCPANDLGLHQLGRAVLQKPKWYNDPATGVVNAFGCQNGATCGLLALTHVLRGLGAETLPLTLARYRAISGDEASENFDLFNLLSFADAQGVSSEPLPLTTPRSSYLLHSPGHYIALVYTRMGTLLCDSLRPLPYVLTADECVQLLDLFCAMQRKTAHVDFDRPERAGGWMGLCLWKRDN